MDLVCIVVSTVPFKISGIARMTHGKVCVCLMLNYCEALSLCQNCYYVIKNPITSVNDFRHANNIFSPL